MCFTTKNTDFSYWTPGASSNNVFVALKRQQIQQHYFRMIEQKKIIAAANSAYLKNLTSLESLINQNYAKS
uniref:Uncharacterized protein n=1 Tax=Romanomermis culicivorax TaxID=13658 RepID=A0A915HNY8_ROMCU